MLERSNPRLPKLLLLFWLPVLLLTAGCSHTTTESVATPANVRPAAAVDRSGTPTEGWCQQLPKVSVASHSTAVHCIGLIDNQLGFPRGVLAWANDIIVVDKGSHLHQQRAGATAGRVLRYTPTPLGFKQTVLLDGLNNPSSLSRGRHPADKHQLYVSTTDAILRFAPDAVEPKAARVVDNLPLSGWHYISAAYATPDYLFVTIPSASDHCEATTQGQFGAADVLYPCPEVNPLTSAANTKATIRRYSINKDGSIANSFQLIAHGLRDALAMTTSLDGNHLLVADNGWDDVPNTALGIAGDPLPLDELNLVPIQATRPQHYGWPYCYQRTQTTQAITPGYEQHVTSCASYTDALLVMPAHSAPLALLQIDQQLFANLHGFSNGGRKTLRWATDKNGIPTNVPEVLIDWNYSHNKRYQGGRPFGLATYGNNALLVTDDWNRSLMIVRLSAQFTATQVSGDNKK